MTRQYFADLRTPGWMHAARKFGTLFRVLLIVGLCSFFGGVAVLGAAHGGEDIDNSRQTEASNLGETVTMEGYFSCKIPADWFREGSFFGLSQEEKKVYGYTFSKDTGDAVPLRISVHYYAEGNLLHATPDLFIARKSHPIFEPSGSYRNVELFDTVIAGRPAKTFMRPYHQFVSAEPMLPDPAKDDKEDPRVYEQREMMARKIPLIERYLVIPAATGFFVLGYSAPEELYDEHLDAFEQVVVTFNPLQ